MAVRRMLGGAALAALLLLGGCAQGPAGGTAPAPAQSTPAAADSTAADSAPAAAPAQAPLTAQDLVWLVEPTYAYDDVAPIWAWDFNDAGLFGLVCADGTQTLDEENAAFSEMNFPQYSCLPQYYAVYVGDGVRLFYMPTRQDSGGLDTVGSLTDKVPYILDATGIQWDLYPLWLAGEEGRLPAPWNVMAMAERGVATARLGCLTDDGQVHFLGDWGTDVPLTEITLHKPYPLQRGTLKEDEGGRYFEADQDGYAFAAPDGTLLTDFLYDETGTFSDGICAACRDGKWGYLDDTGREVTEFIYDAPWPYDADFDYDRSLREYRFMGYPCTSDTMVVRRDGEMGVLYRDGSLLIEFGEFEDLAPAWNNELWAKQDGLWGLIDLADAKRKAGLPEWAAARPYDPDTDEPHPGADSLKLLEVQPDTLLAAPEWEARTVRADPALDMRTGPGTEYGKAVWYYEDTGIPNGSTVTVVSAPQDGWVLATPDDWIFGWVQAEYLE